MDSGLVTASFPSPAQDYETNLISLDQHLILRPEATFIVRVGADLPRLGLRQQDELVVDRSLQPVRGELIVVVDEVAGEHRVGRYQLQAGRPVLQAETLLPLTEQQQLFGVVTVLIRGLRAKSRRDAQ